MVERLFVRIVVAAALCAALLAFAFVPIPIDTHGDPHLPMPAFEQTSLYRLEVALLVFYGVLLLATPAFSGLLRGHLPVEISTRGARFAEEADQSAARDEAAIREMEEVTSDLGRRLSDAQLEIKRLNEIADSDSKQPKIGLTK